MNTEREKLSTQEHFRQVRDLYDQRADHEVIDLNVSRFVGPQTPDEIRTLIEQMEDYWARLIISGCEGRLTLDAGCGNGNILVRMLELEKSVRCVGVDLSFGVLERAKRRTVGIFPALRGFAQANVLHLPFKDQSFGAASCLEVLGYMPSNNAVLAALDELHRVLKLGGILVIATATNTFSIRGAVLGFAMRLLLPRSVEHQALNSSIWFFRQLRKKGFRVQSYRGWDRPVVNRASLYWLNRPMRFVDFIHSRLSDRFRFLHLLRDRVVFRCVKLG